jgi:5'-3' exonuclease
MTYILVDTANTFFRARHAINGDADIKLGMAFHITLNSIRKAWQQFNGSHVIFFLEGRSWRKDFYTPYKAQRAAARAAHNEKQADEEKVFWEAFDTFKDFISDKTNCTVLQHPELEADDLIAGWIQSHPSDQHVIISTDTDFVQLIASNVKQYNGVMECTITDTGHYNDKGKPIIDKKTQLPKPAPNPEWLLFEKCMRGDTSDNVFSAYPGVRTKGTSKKVGLTEAFEDRLSKGFAWNNLMLQRWIDHNQAEHRVLEDYERNKTLIDLTQQPQRIKEIINTTIVDATSTEKNVGQVGVKLMKFCGLYDLRKIADQAQSYAEPLNATYARK